MRKRNVPPTSTPPAAAAAGRGRQTSTTTAKTASISPISTSEKREEDAVMQHDPLSQEESGSRSTRKSPQWLVLAIGSGAFAATNGVFAKLTTANTTNSIALVLANTFGVSDSAGLFEWILRAMFFGLNVLSNTIMWYLFTRALTAGTSTTRVTILNTSANFMVTAVLGMLIFSEQLPMGWWLGAAMLVAGSVIIGTREGAAQAKHESVGAEQDAVPLGSETQSLLGSPVEQRYRDDTRSPSPLISDS